MFYLSKKKGERKQVNIRVPIFLDDIVSSQADLLNLRKNDMYIVMLYDYIHTRGYDAQRKD